MKITKYRKVCRRDPWLPDVLPELINHGRSIFDRTIEQTAETLEKWIETTAVHVAFHPYKKLTGDERNLRNEAELGRPIGPVGAWRAVAVYLEIFFILAKTSAPNYPTYRLFPIEASNAPDWGIRRLRDALGSRDLYGANYETIGVMKKTYAEISGFCTRVAIDIFKFPEGKGVEKLLLGTKQ